MARDVVACMEMHASIGAMESRKEKPSRVRVNRSMRVGQTRLVSNFDEQWFALHLREVIDVFAGLKAA